MRPCPECGSDSRIMVKSWDATPRAMQGSIRVQITIWECHKCGHRYRTAERTWKISSLGNSPDIEVSEDGSEEPLETEEDRRPPARMKDRRS